MARYKQILDAGLVMGAVTLPACVTINIYFQQRRPKKLLTKLLTKCGS
jgi:hypothetical protein